MNLHNERTNGCFGYRLLKPMFFIIDKETKKETVDFLKMVQIFNNKLTEIIIFNEPRDGFEASIHLNAIFLDNMMSSIKTINKTPSLRSVFRHFLIIEPHETISVFIDENQSLFQQNGWSLEQKPYEHKKRGSTSNNVLFIKPL